MDKRTLAKHFPMIRSRQEILQSIYENPKLSGIFHSWKTSEQKEFLDFCSGMKGMKILYDGSETSLLYTDIIGELPIV